MNNANRNAVVSAAERVTLVFVVNPVVRELYGVAERALDEVSTLRRVSLFLRGTGAYVLTQDEKDVALAVVRSRAD